MKLRDHIIGFAAATMLPVTLVAVAAGYLLVEREREAFERGALERTRALATAVDAQLDGRIDALLTLATSPLLDDESEKSLADFRAIAERVLAANKELVDIVLLSSAGQQRMNLLAPPGAPPRPVVDPAGFVRIMQTGEADVSDVGLAPVANTLVFAVRVPVIRDGRTRQVLGAIVDVGSVAKLLSEQQVPKEWIAAVIDRNGRFVARTRAVAPGTEPKATATFARMIDGRQDGWGRAESIEGVDNYAAFARSRTAGWVVAVGIPATVVNAGAVRALWLFAAGLLAAVAIAGGLGWMIARRLARPIVSLAATARELKAGGVAPTAWTGTSIDEINDLGTVLHEAVANVGDREERLRIDARAKDEFLAMLSHELRNPLAVLKSSSFLLKSNLGPAVISRSGEMIERQVDHMTSLVDDLLDASRVSGGKIKLTKVPLDLADLVARLLSTWREVGRLEQHSVSSTLSPAWVLADESRMIQVVTNLVDNALKYTPPGGEVRIRVARIGAFSVLRISDTGQGIADDLKDRLFDLFVQGDRGLARTEGGLGVGLTLVKHIVEMHDGSVVARSAGVDRGSTFRVALPAIDAPARNARTEDLPGRRKASSLVLLIEDDKEARDTLSGVLKLKGHEVLEAENGLRGIELALAKRPQLVLVDIGLPDIDGYDVARRIRRARPGTTLVAVTGYGRAEDKRQAIEAGFDDHITKPLSAENVDRLIDSIGH